mmetsp:Transcript_18325/g.44241  ORF Transcript_18325/g.44241 Transcript_18325/m.44241 type:complete len:458 (+) Transcript_18325:193-1566(+)
MVSSTTADDGTSGGGRLGIFDLDRIGEDFYDFLFTPSTNKDNTTRSSRPAAPPAARRSSKTESSSRDERDDNGDGLGADKSPDLSIRSSLEKDGERESSGTSDNKRSKVSSSKSSSSSRSRCQSSAEKIEAGTDATGVKNSRKEEDASKTNSTPEQKEPEAVVSGAFQDSINDTSHQDQPMMAQQSSSSSPPPTATADAESSGDPLMAELKTKLKVVSQRHDAGIPWVPQHGTKIPTTPSEETLPPAARALPARYTLSHVKSAATTTTPPKQDDFMKELQLWHKKHKLQKTAKKCTHDNHLLELKEWHEKKMIMSPRTVNIPAEDPEEVLQENEQPVDAPSKSSEAKSSKSRSSESIKSKTEVVAKVQRRWGLFSCFPKKKTSSKQKSTVKMTDSSLKTSVQKTSKSSKNKDASSSSASSSSSSSSSSSRSRRSKKSIKSSEQRRQKRKKKLSESLF